MSRATGIRLRVPLGLVGFSNFASDLALASDTADLRTHFVFRTFLAKDVQTNRKDCGIATDLLLYLEPDLRAYYPDTALRAGLRPTFPTVDTAVTWFREHEARDAFRVVDRLTPGGRWLFMQRLAWYLAILKARLPPSERVKIAARLAMARWRRLANWGDGWGATWLGIPAAARATHGAGGQGTGC